MTKGPDIAFRRLSCIGFPVSDELDRISFLSQWMNSNFAGITFSVGHIFKGPVRSRSLTAISYIEFTDADVRNAVLKLIRSKKLSCVYKGKEINLKPGLSQIIRNRIWALNKAYEMLKAEANASQFLVELRKEGSRAVLSTEKLHSIIHRRPV